MESIKSDNVPLSARLQNMAFSDETSNALKHKVRCASVHLFSGVHLQYLLDFGLEGITSLFMPCCFST